MGKIEDIAKAIQELSPADLSRFRSWFAEFDAERFDRRIEADAAAGRLDELAEAAVKEHRSGRSREL